MARRRRLKAIVGDPSDPHGMAAEAADYLEWLKIRNYSPETLKTRGFYLDCLIQWLEERGVSRPGEVTKPMLERYQRYLYHYRKENGEPLSFRSQHSHLVPVRAFFKWLTRYNHILYNPASELVLPRLEKRLPKHVLSASEAEQVMNQPDIQDTLGLRDRAILETLYSTGMRRTELLNLHLYDLDASRGTVMIRQGKGKKDRMVPIGERALAWVEKYLHEARPLLSVPPDEHVLFLTNAGECFTADHLSQVVRGYIIAANIDKTGSCHLFRHTMATLMLENGADIRFIQEMLGHADLSTTQIYAQVSIRQLKQIHAATHPARLHRNTSKIDDTDIAAEKLSSSLAAENENNE